MKEVSLEELAKVIREAKKEKVYKRDAHKGTRQLGTLEEELDRIDRGREAGEKIAAKYVGTRKPK